MLKCRESEASLGGGIISIKVLSYVANTETRSFEFSSHTTFLLTVNISDKHMQYLQNSWP